MEMYSVLWNYSRNILELKLPCCGRGPVFPVNVLMFVSSQSMTTLALNYSIYISIKIQEDGFVLNYSVHINIKLVVTIYNIHINEKYVYLQFTVYYDIKEKILIFTIYSMHIKYIRMENYNAENYNMSTGILIVITNPEGAPYIHSSCLKSFT